MVAAGARTCYPSKNHGNQKPCVLHLGRQARAQQACGENALLVKPTFWKGKLTIFWQMASAPLPLHTNAFVLLLIVVPPAILPWNCSPSNVSIDCCEYRGCRPALHGSRRCVSCSCRSSKQKSFCFANWAGPCGQKHLCTSHSRCAADHISRKPLRKH